ncbi:MAG TPA: alpha/beta hydrolase [Desulfosporosinus sp.]|nr:alpha/beta hydrolase [Desulfosporosinus sp.]
MPYITIQGNKTHYYQKYNFQDDLPTLLFVHGAGGSGKNWSYQLAGIPGYNLIALDLPGHGHSEGSVAENITEYCQFVRSFAQALELKQFTIAGHSMGGAIALELALGYPEVITGIIIVDSGARLRVNPTVLDKLSRGEHPLENIKYSYSPNSSPDIIAKATEEMKRVPTDIYLADFKACNEFNVMDRVHTIIKPTLIICGQNDQMTPLKYSEYLHKELPHSTLALISDAGHMAMLEQPDQVNSAINNFLTQTFSHSIKTISAYVNVALVDYDDSVRNHVVELMKESLREKTNETILETTWNVEESKRTLFKNEEGVWETQPFDSTPSEEILTREMLEVMTVRLFVDIVSIS